VKRTGLADRWQAYLRSASAQERPIAPVLLLTIATIMLTPLLDGFKFGLIVLVVLIGVAALMALIRTGASRRIRLGASIAVISAIVAVSGPTSTGEPITQGTGSWQQVLAQVMFVLLLVITPTVVMLRLLLRPRITLDTLAGALTAYLQIGLFFAALYRLLNLVDSDAFFGPGVETSAQTYQYFSFITLTTVGYGDYTPATELGQTLASVEAIFGQVFLVTVVALTVSNLGRELPHRRGLHPEEESDAPDEPDGPGS